MLYGNLGAVFQCLVKYDKAKEYLDKALAIKIQTGDKNGEASLFGNLRTATRWICLRWPRIQLLHAL